MEIKRNQSGFMLRQIRRVLDIKQLIFAGLMGVTEQTIVHWEKNGPKHLTLEQLKTLYDAGINPMYVCGGTEMFLGGLTVIQVRENILKLAQIRVKNELKKGVNRENNK